MGEVIPTPEQIEQAQLMGWEYMGDGIFSRDDQLGWFSENGFERD